MNGPNTSALCCIIIQPKTICIGDTVGEQDDFLDAEITANEILHSFSSKR